VIGNRFPRLETLRSNSRFAQKLLPIKDVIAD